MLPFTLSAKSFSYHFCLFKFCQAACIVWFLQVFSPYLFLVILTGTKKLMGSCIPGFQGRGRARIIDYGFHLRGRSGGRSVFWRRFHMPISRGQLLQRRPSILLSWGGHGGTHCSGFLGQEPLWFCVCGE